MNKTFEDYVNELGLERLSKEDATTTLASVSMTVHKQFLLDLYDAVGEENFNAIKMSIKLGAALYITTLKHLAPNYLDIYAKSQEKIFSKLKEGV